MNLPASIEAQPLTRRHTLPVHEDARGLIPANTAYEPLRRLLHTGFRFTGLQLLHAVGCKTTSLPRAEKDRCVIFALRLAELIDFGRTPLQYRRRIDSDLLTARSQEIGIGMTCLLASRCWSIDWDQLQAISRRGKRFDYRAIARSIRCIFESKGTSHRTSQRGQIAHGLAKKRDQHKKEKADVALILSTCVGMPPVKPRILVADPPVDWEEAAFGPGADLFFRLRHYSRVLQFIGATESARRVYAMSNESAPQELMPYIDFRHRLSSYSTTDLRRLETRSVGGQVFFGTRVDTAELDAHYRRRSRSIGIEWSGRVQLFQGLREDVVAALNEADLTTIEGRKISALPDDDAAAISSNISVFPDGSILAIE
jgi:hypothetical protein